MHAKRQVNYLINICVFVIVGREIYKYIQIYMPPSYIRYLTQQSSMPLKFTTSGIKACAYIDEPCVLTSVFALHSSIATTR